MLYSRRTFLKSSGMGLAAVTLTWAGFRCFPRKRRPNFVFILIDDLGWKDVGFMGSDFYETPNVDRLADEGMVFNQAYANAPNCAPTRACIMSGQYTPRHGIYTVNSSERGKASRRKLIPVSNTTSMAVDNITIGEILHSAAYKTFHGGKWHLGYGEKTGPEGQGFDVNIGGCQKGSPGGRTGGYFSPWQGLPGLEEAPNNQNLTDRLTDEAIRFIQKHRQDPFFVYLAYYSVHTPLQAKIELIEKYRKKLEANCKRGIQTLHNHPIYAAMVENTDWNIGRLMNVLAELGLNENTVVAFFSDNGGEGTVTSMQPLRGAKGMMYEGGIRSPMVVRWPGVVEPGSTCKVPVISTDFYPTILDIAGLKKPVGKILDGESLTPLLKQCGGLKREALFWHFPCYLEAYRKDRHYDASHDPGWRTTPCGAVRKGDWKLIEYFEEGDLELYHLKNDIGERKNLAAARPEKVRELHDLLKSWRKSVNAPVPTEKNPAYQPIQKDIKTRI